MPKPYAVGMHATSNMRNVVLALGSQLVNSGLGLIRHRGRRITPSHPLFFRPGEFKAVWPPIRKAIFPCLFPAATVHVV